MNALFRPRDRSSKGAALMIVLALVVLLTGIALAYFSRTTTDRQLAQASYNDTSADLFARSALDIVVGSLKQEILNGGTTVRRSNIQPQRSGDDASIPNLIRRSIRDDAPGGANAIPAPGVPSLASAITSGPLDPRNVKRGEIRSARWNSHYLVPRLNTGNAVDSTPISTFTVPDWVLVTRAGPAAFSGWDNSLKDPGLTNTNYVVGRYAFGVYDEGGLLDMSMAGFPSWSGDPDTSCNPAPAATPWLVNVGRKGTVGLADLTALPASTTTYLQQTQIDKIVGWRNYATSLRTYTNFPAADPGFLGQASCTIQDSYGTYLLYFGEPPFTFDVTDQPIPNSSYPFTSIYPAVNSSRTDQALITRQELLKLERSLDNPPGQFSQNVLQYVGTFSRERNRPAPDWPYLQNNLSEGRFCFDNLDMVKPNPDGCTHHGNGKGQGKSRGRGHLCGTEQDLANLFGLKWIKSSVLGPDPSGHAQPGRWRYIGHNGPWHDPNPNAIDHIPPFRGPNHQNDFFQILDYALFRVDYGITGDADPTHRSKSFAIGASLIDQYDSGSDCSGGNTEGCDLDLNLTGNDRKYQTHTTIIDYGGGALAYGMELNHTGPNNDSTNGDDPWQGSCASSQSGNNPHRPCGAPTPNPNTPTQVVSRGFTTVGEFGYGIDSSPSGVSAGVPTLKLWDSSTNFQYAPVLDFFSYNPVSSAYPRAGIVNLYTKHEPVIAAMLQSALKNDTVTTPPASVISPSEAMQAAHSIVCETQWVLTGTNPAGCSAPLGVTVTQTDMTRAIAGRLAARAFRDVPSLATSDDTKGAVVRALAEMGQTRTWNLLIDVIAQTGHYGPNAQGLTDFIPEGEKRYWLHVALGRDLVRADGITPCQPGDTGCRVDVLGTQLEEVIE
jgi:hypothetical protein